jgi:hypothetical protein
MLTFIEKPAEWDKLTPEQLQPEELALGGIPPESADDE